MFKKLKTLFFKNSHYSINSIKHILNKDMIKYYNKIKNNNIPLKISTIYVFWGIVWILISDILLDMFIHNHNTITLFQIYKGLSFVIITGIIIYILIRKDMNVIQNTSVKLLENYKKLEIAHKELTSIEEELRYQYNELDKSQKRLIIHKERYNLAINGANDGIWDWDIKSNKLFLSDRWVNMLGYDTNELKHSFDQWKSLIHPEDVSQALAYLKKYLKSGHGHYENIYRIKTKNGDYKWILARGKAQWDYNGRAIRMAGSHSDITNIKNIEDNLRKEKNFSESILNGANIIIIVWNMSKRIIRFNRFAEKVTGFSQEEALGKKLLDLIIPEDIMPYMRKTFDKIKQGNTAKNHENKILCKNGNTRDILWNNHILYNKDNMPFAVVSMGTDITERKKSEKDICNLAYFDQLTKLPNRTSFENSLDKKIENAKLNDTNFALIYFDLDNFKYINDTFGHTVGDQLLKTVSQRLKSFIDNNIVLGRLGGDEFALLINHNSNNDIIIDNINSILKTFSFPFVINNKNIYMSASVGIAIYPKDGTDRQVLMRNADVAMYNSKNNGKNQHSFYKSYMHKKTINDFGIESDLRRAINNNEFVLHYQPQIDLKSGKLIGVEALIRWNNPYKGIIMPLDFIPIAEQSGLIATIGKWVLKTACIQHKLWHEKGFNPIKVSVNLSLKQFKYDDIDIMIKDIIQETGIDSKYLELEITESSTIDNFGSNINILNKLKNLGVMIALDDFGVGYSSLNQLKNLPVDVIKVDKSFVKNIITDANDAVLVRSIIKMSKALKLKVVAEGIEDFNQLKFLQSYDCDIGQGYLFSKPVDADTIENILKYNNSTFFPKSIGTVK
ncbi:sensor domain-containing protein [Clostridiisalibacter paucivorans]|uniref:sensor domain-containing protein n=1 Tax=Clostridiisalibacter paucivorans TaxID=408753 RepID=UPI00047888C0|nr:GGDEF domain-containing phosphodiesterase [Clostridiisalibacter paucivorans]